MTNFLDVFSIVSVDAILTIEDKNDNYLETIEFKDILDKNTFSYVDEDEACFVSVKDDEITINRRLISHNTRLIFNENPLIEISTNEGTLKFNPKVIENKKNNGIITIVYTINDTIKELRIKYIGV